MSIPWIAKLSLESDNNEPEKKKKWVKYKNYREKIEQDSSEGKNKW
jgi:hypothetical protein